MADGDQPQMTPGAAGDVPDGTLLQSGAVSYKGKEHQLHLMPTGLRLVAPQDQDRAGAPTTSECVHLMLFFLLVLLAIVCQTFDSCCFRQITSTVSVAVSVIPRKGIQFCKWQESCICVH